MFVYVMILKAKCNKFIQLDCTLFQNMLRNYIYIYRNKKKWLPGRFCSECAKNPGRHFAKLLQPNTDISCVLFYGIQNFI